jgi:hypothetical protein
VAGVPRLSRVRKVGFNGLDRMGFLTDFSRWKSWNPTFARKERAKLGRQAIILLRWVDYLTGGLLTFHSHLEDPARHSSIRVEFAEENTR